MICHASHLDDRVRSGDIVIQDRDIRCVLGSCCGKWVAVRLKRQHEEKGA